MTDGGGGEGGGEEVHTSRLPGTAGLNLKWA